MTDPYPNSLRLRISAEDGAAVNYASSNTVFDDIDRQYVQMTTEWDLNRFVIYRDSQPDYEPEFDSIRVEIIGFEDEPLGVKVDDSAAPVWYYENNIVELVIGAFKKIQVTTPIGHSDETIVSRPPEL